MTRSYSALLLVATLAGCVTEPAEETSASQQAASGGHFPNAKMPVQPQWNGAKPPAPGPKQGYVLWMDAQGGYWNALLADTGKGTIPYAVKVSSQDIGPFMSVIGGYGRFDGGRVPPPIGPTGGDWIARYGLELQLDVEGAHGRAMLLSY